MGAFITSVAASCMFTNIAFLPKKKKTIAAEVVWPLSEPEVKGAMSMTNLVRRRRFRLFPLVGGAAHHLPLIRLGPLYRRIGDGSWAMVIQNHSKHP